MAESTPFEHRMRSYLHFCRTEKGLADNSLQCYKLDLARFGAFLGTRVTAPEFTIADVILFESTLTREAAVYSPLQTYRL